jgi:eukaryotic-like serine/threonine-protein kinase
MLDQLVGQTIDQFKIVSMLGGGGMGKVFKARDLSLQRDVAIKVMHPHIAEQPNFRERFLQEARTAARLDHPGIVQVYHFGQSQGLLYIVMKYIQGIDLDKMLRDLKASGKWILLDEATQLIRQVALALDYAHHQGVLHRDIKPGNIMIEPIPTETLPYRPVITDLGLAKLLEGGLVTSTGMSMGTPAYMSPEQAMGETTDARSDVYSLGVQLFELCTGRLPFQVRTITEAIRYHTKEPPPMPRSIRPDLPQELELIILKAMEKDPARRYQNAGELANILGRLSSEGLKVTKIVAGGPAVSLMTQLQQSQVGVRGPSIMQEFPQQAQNAKGDEIQVMLAGGKIRSVTMKPAGLVVGRIPGNDIILDDNKVSRHHARIDFDGRDYRVTDMKSSNGTFLANVKLLPEKPEIWTPEKMLRIGDTWLKLVRAQPAAGVPAGTYAYAQGTVAVTSGTPGIAVPQGGGGGRSSSGRIGAFLETNSFTVEPGQGVIISILLINQGEVVDHFKSNLFGIAPAWIPELSKPVQLMPGEQKSISLTIRPPRTPQSRAGSYPVVIRISSEKDANQVLDVNAQLVVTSFEQFSSELTPQRVRAGQKAQVLVRNQGNIQQNFLLSLKDRGQELDFQPPQDQVRVPEGQDAAVVFKASPRQRRWIGGEKTHAFTAQVAASKGDPQVHSGEVVSRALIPPWVIPLLTMLCILLIALLVGVQWYLSDQASRATATVLAINTQVKATFETATAVAVEIANANQATLDSLTATAAWMPGDDDRDGLSNADELKYGTMPDKRDTDEDGLDDGVEVTKYKTEPLVADTDGDGLKDGAEVSMGTDPLKTDSDNDGIPDSKDTAPLATSTPTADVQATADAGTQAVLAAQTAAAQQTLAAEGTKSAEQTLAAGQTATAQKKLDDEAAAAAAKTKAAARTQTVQAAKDQKLLAFYPLAADAKDASLQADKITLENAPFQNGGVYCNGYYSGPSACKIVTPNLDDLNWDNFWISVDFRVDKLKTMPVFIGGNSYRWIGFYLNDNGTVSLKYNNSSYQNCGLMYSINDWHNALIAYNGGNAYLYLDGTWGCTVPFALVHGTDKNVGVTDYSSGNVFEGWLKNLKIGH